MISQGGCQVEVLDFTNIVSASARDIFPIKSWRFTAKEEGTIQSSPTRAAALRICLSRHNFESWSQKCRVAEQDGVSHSPPWRICVSSGALCTMLVTNFRSPAFFEQGRIRALVHIPKFGGCSYFLWNT